MFIDTFEELDDERQPSSTVLPASPRLRFRPIVTWERPRPPFFGGLGFQRRQNGAAGRTKTKPVLSGHRARRRNAGEAAWLVVSGRLVVVYEHPDGDDPLVARIVTVWRRR